MKYIYLIGSIKPSFDGEMSWNYGEGNTMTIGTLGWISAEIQRLIITAVRIRREYVRWSTDAVMCKDHVQQIIRLAVQQSSHNRNTCSRRRIVAKVRVLHEETDGMESCEEERGSFEHPRNRQRYDRSTRMCTCACVRRE